MKSALIFGINGGIGRELAAHLAARGVEVRGSVSPGSDAAPGTFPLELTDTESLRSCPLPAADIAFFCAGVTRLADCAADPKGSGLVNVEAPAILCRRLTAKGAYFLYLSSSSVCDGLRPHMPPEAPHAPRTEYGRQKAAAETALLPMGAGIARLTKVLGPGSIAEHWLRELRAGRVIRPFSDLTLAPVSLQRTVRFLAEIGLRRQGGVWQLSGAKDIRYAEAARVLAAAIGAAPHLVVPRTVAESGTHLEDAPPFTSLDMSRLAEFFPAGTGGSGERSEWIEPESLDSVLHRLASR